MRTLKVLFAPFITATPYQERLRELLLPGGIEVRGVPLPEGAPDALYSELSSWRPDLLHLHWLHPWFLGQNFLATLARSRRFLAEVRAARARGTRLVWTAHNLVNHEQQHVAIDRFVTRRIGRLADAIIAHSRQAKERVAACCGLADAERIAVIPQGNHIDDYPNEISRAAARAALGVAEGACLFLFLGRVRPYKGVFELIDAFRAADLPADCALHIAGKTHDERERLRLKKRCRKAPRVVLHYGFVEVERVQVFMNAADFVVLPYRDILSSGAAILATSFGKAVVAPDIGCLREAVAADGAILYDPDAAGGLARALEAAAGARSRSAAMGEANLALARAWPWSSMAECTRALYLRVMAGRTV